MSLELQIIAAVILDFCFGDPRWLPHPVRFIGALASASERPLLRVLRNRTVAGIIAVVLVLTATGSVVGGGIYLATLVHPVLADFVSVLLLYTAFAAKDLSRHSRNVYTELESNNLVAAQEKVGFIVGRDTHNMDETEVVRATVETVAENTVDGVTAPLFYAVIAGPLGALLYKSINTLDSLFGYRNERYLFFGRFAARLDDVANYLPARVTAILLPFVAGGLGHRFIDAFKILLRDGRKHPSPNAGLTEAAMAGGLGIQLGGRNTYRGILSEKPRLGDAHHLLDKKHILQANAIMWGVLLLTLILLLGVRLLVVQTLL